MSIKKHLVKNLSRFADSPFTQKLIRGNSRTSHSPNITKKTVSVLMSVYNSGGKKEIFLRQAIESILAQTHKEFELILIDDGSTDSTVLILEEYSRKDPRIFVHKRPHQGLTASLNFGIDQAHGDYIARQDADDVSEPNRIGSQLQFIGKYSLVASGWTKIVGKESQPSLTSEMLKLLPPKAIGNVLNFGNFFAHGTYFFNKKEIKEIGGYRSNFKYTQDYDLLLRILDRYSIGFQPENLYRLRIHKQSTSQTQQKDQLLYALLAGFFSQQRKAHESESYQELSPDNPEALFKELKAKHKWYLASCLAINSIRTQTLSKLKYLKP